MPVSSETITRRKLLAHLFTTMKSLERIEGQSLKARATEAYAAEIHFIRGLLQRLMNEIMNDPRG